MAKEPQFCRFPQKPVRYFDKRSFRTVRTDGHRVVIGCKKGHWAARKKECKVGTTAQSILYPVGTKRCPVWKPLAKGAKELGQINKKHSNKSIVIVIGLIIIGYSLTKSVRDGD